MQFVIYDYYLGADAVNLLGALIVVLALLNYGTIICWKRWCTAKAVTIEFPYKTGYWVD